MLRLVLRPLLVIFTLGMLVIALFQVGGRITLALLDDLELGVNQLLSIQGVRVTGLSGDWRMLNPIIRADQLDLPAGQLRGLVVEVDMVASVLRGTLLARRLKVDHLHLKLEKPEGEPWRLRGDTGGPGLDLLPFLKHSNQMELAGVVVFAREGLAPAQMTLSYLGINRGGEHRHALRLANAEDDCADADTCHLELDFYSHAALWPLRAGQVRVTARSSGFLLPKSLLGISALKVDELDLDWQLDPKESGGSVRVAVEQFDLPGSGTLAMAMEGVVRGRGRGRASVHHGAVDAWRVQQGSDVWELPRVAVSADDQGVHVWMPALDLARTSQFLRQALAAVEPAEEWLTGLNLRGRAHNLRAYYPFDGVGPSYAMTVDGLQLDAFRGAPAIANAAGELFGHQRGVQLNLNAQDLAFALPDLFHDAWQLPYAQGVLQGWFSRDYFGIRGLSLRVEALGTRAAGGFAISRPADASGQRLLLMIGADRMEVAEAKQFVPYKLPEQLLAWLRDGPRGGELSDARVAYQGQLRLEPGELGRRLELAAEIDRGRVRYHADWPEVTGVRGQLAVMGPAVEVNVIAARSAGANLTRSRVRLLDNGAVVDATLDAELGAETALALIRGTPLQGWLAFVEEDWRGEGPMRLSGELRVPLPRAVEAGASPYTLGVRLRADLEGVQLSLPRYRSELSELQGSLRYRFPHELDATEVKGRMFGEPVAISAGSDPQGMHLSFSGRAGSDDVWQLLELDDPGLAVGAFDYRARLSFGVASARVPELTVSSPLEGLALTLPGGYGKAAEATDDVYVRLRFLREHRSVSFDYRDVAGWLDFDGAPLRGAVGFATAPPRVDPHARELVVAGLMNGFALADVTGGTGIGGGMGGGNGAVPLPIRLEDLEVEEIDIGGFPLSRATLRGRLHSDGFDLLVRSRELTGSISRDVDGPMVVRLDQLNLPGGMQDPLGADPGNGLARGRADPLDPAVISRLPAANVELQRLMLGEEDFGSWRFQMRTVDDVLQVRELEALVRGVQIVAPDGVDWRADSNETRFTGALAVQNLAAVLPQWGYAPTVETGSASLSGAFTWAGSPAAVDLLTLRGEAEARAEAGRFLDVDSGAAGAQRIFSLLNFTAIAKRMSLNFSDVFGRGISFDKLKAPFSLDEGMLEFVEPLQVEGTGSSFRVSGWVDLRARRLHNEMVVTLPVSKGLPWYAAYVALANPLAGLGMLVGERVLRKPLEQFSSAKYRIGGTLDDPEVRFVSVFDVSTNEPVTVADIRAAEAEIRAAEAKIRAAEAELIDPQGENQAEHSPASPAQAPVADDQQEPQHE
ncbi:MAG: YhdP family protein [Pseudomonadales bacterium]